MVKTAKDIDHGVLTERITTFKTESELADFFNESMQPVLLKDFLEKSLVGLDSRLNKLGLPMSYMGVHKKGNGGWEYFDASKVNKKDGFKVEVGLKFITTKYESFSEEWVAAKINFSVWEVLQHLNKETPNMGEIAMMMYGLGRNSMAYEFNIIHGNDALGGQRNRNARTVADKAKGPRAKEREEDRLECIAELWHEAREKDGSEAMRQDLNAARAVHALAEISKPEKLIVQSKRQILSIETIRKKIPILRMQGRLS